MSDTKDYLIGEVKRLHAKAQDILDTAEKAVRDLTEEETAEVKATMARVEEHRVELKRIEDREGLREQLDRLGTVTEIASAEAEVVEAKSPGDAFTRSPDYQAILKEIQSSGMPRFDNLVVEMKAAGDPVLESDGTPGNSTAIAPTWFGLEAPGLYQFEPLVQDVLNIVQLTTGNTANYPTVKTRSIESQAATAEGAAKKGANFEFEFESETLQKWTAFGGASEEMFQDAPTLVNYINTELGRMALQSEEAGIVSTLLTATTQSSSGATISDAPNDFDAIREALAVIRLEGGRPNAILINPLDSAKLDVVRSGAGAAGDGGGMYYSGGPVQAAAQGLWGSIRRVETPALSEGTALVGDFVRGARLFRKGGLRVDSSNSHGSYFRENKVAIRGEVRSVLGVTYPEFFCEIDINSAS